MLSLDALEHSIESLKNVFAQHDDALATLAPTPYPLLYLRALADLEEKRQNFIKAPSNESYLVYERGQKKTLRLLEESIENYRALVERHIPEGDIRYRSAGGVISKEDALESLANLQKGLSETRARTESRYTCVRLSVQVGDETQGCARSRRTEESFAFPYSVVAKSKAPLPLNSRAQLLEAGLPDVITWEGSYTLIAASTTIRCLSFLEKPSYFAVFDRRSEEGLRAFYPHLLNDLYFWDAETLAATNPSNRYFTSMLEFDIPYSYQPVTNFYMCPDAIRMLSGIATAIVLEEQGEKTPAREASLAKRFYTGGFERIIAWLALQNESYARGVSRGYFSPPSIPFVILIRAPFPLTFLTFNESIAGPQKELVKKEAEPQYLMSLSQLQKKYSDMDIRELLRKALLFELGLDVQ